VVAPLRGATWLAEGLRMFRASPLGWLAMVFAYLVGTLLLSGVPLVGPVAVSLLVPALSVGFMEASRAASLAQRVELRMLFAGFRERLPQQLVLGGVYFLGFAAALAGSALFDDGALVGLVLAVKPPEDADAAVSAALPGMLGAVALYLPTMVLLWYSPVLVAWHGIAPLKALFYSAAAFWLNRRAFAAYGAAVSLALLALALCLMALAALVPASTALNPRSLVLPLALALLPTLLASYYASYRDVFEAKAGG
jgi:hypothetical protein